MSDLRAKISITTTLELEMAILSFSGEIINELDGSFMSFEFDYEVYEDSDMTREDVEQMGLDYASFADHEVLNYIMDNLSVSLSLENVEMDEE